MHDALLNDIAGLLQASQDLQAAAPAGKAWDAQADADAIGRMKDAWTRARTAYEHIEGAIAPLFPEIDNSIDARYDDFLQQLNGSGDAYPFDDTGVTGLHAVERILYANVTPQRVIDFESKLPGYKAAAYPATPQEAGDFKNKLCAKVIADATTLRDQWTPQKIDLGGAFQGLVSLMNEQREKVNKAATSEEESRYSQRTMADIRDNLDGTRAIYKLFQTWLVSKANGADVDQKTQHGFDTLAQIYSTYPGDAIPQPPVTWSSLNPSPQDLDSPFGKLYTAVKSAVAPDLDGSVVFEMNAAASALGFPQFKEAP
jgi:iron uptake system component EfeO